MPAWFFRWFVAFPADRPGGPGNFADAVGRISLLGNLLGADCAIVAGRALGMPHLSKYGIPVVSCSPFQKASLTEEFPRS